MMMKKQKPFPHDIGLTTRTAILVPSTYQRNKKVTQATFEKRVRETENFMNKEFGGSTVTRGVGSYTINEKKKRPKLVQENVMIVENFSRPADWKKHRAEVEKYVEDKQLEWTQDSIGFEIQQPRKPLSLHYVRAHKKKLKDVS